MPATLSTSSSSLRERKKLQTRDALAMAAMRLALQHGVERIRVEDIAAAANVSVRTFANYFANKHQALAARYVDRMRHAAEALQRRPAAEPLWDAITEAVQSTWNAVGQGQTAPDPVLADELRVMLGAPSAQGRILGEGIAADSPFALAVAGRTGTDAGDLYPRLVAAAVTVATQVAINEFLRAEPPVPLLPLLHDVLSQLAAGLPDPSA